MTNSLDPDQDQPGCKLLAKVISRRQKSPEVRKELRKKGKKDKFYLNCTK